MDEPISIKILLIHFSYFIKSSTLTPKAFADYFVDVAGDGRINSRLEPDPEAIKRVAQIMVPEQPDNRAKPGEVIEHLNRLRQRLEQAQPMDLPKTSNNQPKFDEFGEIQEK